MVRDIAVGCLIIFLLAQQVQAQDVEDIDAQISILYDILDDPLEPNDSIQSLADALSQASATANNLRGALVADYMLAQVLYRTNRVDSAISIYIALREQVIAVANEEALMVRLAQALGTAYQVQGRYDLALKSYQEALALSTALGSKAKVAIVNYSLGRLHAAIGEPDKAFAYYMQTYEGLADLPPVQKARLYNALGNYYASENRTDSSRHYYQLSLDIHDELGDQRGISHGYNNLAIADYMSGDTEAAIAGFQAALEVRIALGNAYNISDSYYNIGYLYADQGTHGKAIEHYRLGLLYADSAHSPIASRDLLLEMSLSFEALDQYDSAYHYLVRSSALADSVMSETKQNEILALEKQYQTDQLLAKQSVIEKEKELTTFQRNALIIGLLGLILAGSVAYYVQQLRYRYRLVKADRDRALSEKDAELAQKEVDLKQEQIAHFTDQLIHKNELLEQLQQRLDEGQLSRRQSEQLVSQHITQHASPNLQEERDWLNFKIEFEKAYPGFFNALINQCPEISAHDQRLASLLRAALSNKEIARVLNISSDSVVKAKYRLRQKLGFSTQAQLDQFIQGA